MDLEPILGILKNQGICDVANIRRFPMAKPRDTYKYQVRVGRKIVHGGITNDLLRRENEHKRTFGQRAKLSKVGRKTTRDAALAWERQKGYTANSK